MVPNMLFWHETSSKVEKSWKMDFWKFFKIFPLSPRHFGVFFGEKIKNLKFCWKWSETFCFDMKRVLKLKKVEKSRISNFIGAREGGFYYYTEQKNSNYNCNSNFSVDVPWRHVHGFWDGGDFLCNQCNITGERYTMYQDREYIEQFNTRVLSIYRTWCHSKNRTCLWVMEKRKVNHAWFSVSLVFCFSWKLFIVYPRSRRVSG